ncbi:universal stress protein [Actinocorallia sp. A-T 12471]|uniref:universal stress protein n=1 Tax=Actinocorallia sp. A-T 12471 TaxID=3089813 RepID=UPI0029D194FB|nr:universal stress protein [Actinocorallia sp. A-T 12471]MDX6744335.1 universal stress protein [Actinocorallia sp. A-T 12471]
MEPNSTGASAAGAAGPVAVATDGSPTAGTAVRWAAQEAARRRLPLHIVYVREPQPRYGEAVPDGESGADERGRVILAAARASVTGLFPGVPATTEELRGHPAPALIDLASGCSLLVIGHRGTGRFAGLLLGSTGLRVAGRTACPVVVVRGDVSGTRGAVVAGIELERDNAAVLELAFTEARARGASLRAVHSWDTPDLAVLSAGPLDRMEALLEPWAERFPDVKCTGDMPFEHPVAALTGESRHADLLVVGSRGLGGFKGAVLGSVSHGVLHHADCPVAVVTARPETRGGA